LPGII